MNKNQRIVFIGCAIVVALGAAVLGSQTTNQGHQITAGITVAISLLGALSALK